MSNKCKSVCKNYIEHFLTLVFADNGCISISASASLVDIYTIIMSSTIRLNVCPIIATIKKYKWIIKERTRSMMK